MRAGGVILLALLAVLVSTAASDDDSSTDQRFLAGLRERGLYQLAERYCDDRLAQPDLPPARRADLVAELSLVLAERSSMRITTLPE